MARSTVLGLPLGKQKHPKRDLAKNVAKAAAVAAGPALLVPAARKVAPMAKKASQAAGQAGDLMEKGKEAKGAVSEAMDTASGIKDAIDSHSSTIGKVAGVVKAVASKGGNKGSKPKLSHLLEQHCDIAAPRRTVYDQWTQFEMFPTIVKGIESVEQQDDETSRWTAKIGPSRRTWTGKVVEQIPDERIAWKSEGGAQLQGTVTFHDLDVDLTRVLLQMEYKPTGAVEWVGNTLRIQRRRTKRDLRLFKHFLEIRGEETGAWRGTIDADEKLEPAHSGQGRVQRDRRSQGSDRGSGTPAPDPNEEDGRSSRRTSDGQGRRSSSGSRSSSGTRASSGSRSSSDSGGNRTSASRSGGSRSASSRTASSEGRASGRRSSSSSGAGSSGNRSSSSGSRSSASNRSSSGSRSSSNGGNGGRARPSSSGRSSSGRSSSTRSSSGGGSTRRSGSGSTTRSQSGRSRQPARSGA